MPETRKVKDRFYTPKVGDLICIKESYNGSYSLQYGKDGSEELYLVNKTTKGTAAGYTKAACLIVRALSLSQGKEVRLIECVESNVSYLNYQKGIFDVLWVMRDGVKMVFDVRAMWGVGE